MAPLNQVFEHFEGFKLEHPQKDVVVRIHCSSGFVIQKKMSSIIDSDMARSSFVCMGTWSRRY